MLECDMFLIMFIYQMPASLIVIYNLYISRTALAVYGKDVLCYTQQVSVLRKHYLQVMIISAAYI